MELETRYPIFLVHGMGFREGRLIRYWGRIPRRLQQGGAQVFSSRQDSNGTVETNARQLAAELDDILRQTGAERVNVIAHSKGGLEARYLISSMGYGEKIASVTTLSTPHHGSETVDVLMKLPDVLIRFGCRVADLWYRFLGDQQPDTYHAVAIFKTEHARRFNEANPDREGIYYQSFGFVMKYALSDVFMWLPYVVVRHFEGENDGLLSTKSVQWTNFRGVFRGNGKRGISHCDVVDLRRRKLSRKAGEGVSDITELYVDIVRELKEREL